jgi:MFS family permease
VGIDAALALPGLIDPATATRWEVFRHVFRLRSWRTLALAIGVGQIMQNGLTFWGTPYFKRTFELSGTQVATLAPVLGAGSFIGLLGGGFLADRLLRRGVLLARVYVSGFGFIIAAAFLMAAFSTRSLALAAPLLAVGSGFGTLYVGPGFAALLDVTPTPLRSQAQSVANVIMFSSALGYVLVGGLSTLFDDNLRLAMLCASPVYAIGGVIILLARRTYVADVALVVAEARYLSDREADDGGPPY